MDQVNPFFFLLIYRFYFELRHSFNLVLGFSPSDLFICDVFAWFLFCLIAKKMDVEGFIFIIIIIIIIFCQG